MSRNKTLILTITQKDIDKGVAGACEACPIALSLQRRFPKRACSIDYEYGHIDNRRFYVTREVEMFMSRVDQSVDFGKPVYASPQPTRLLVEFLPMSMDGVTGKTDFIR